VYRFPAYAPELNPDEYVWNQSKRYMANAILKHIDELSENLRMALGRVGGLQRLLKACLHMSTLSFNPMYPLLYESSIAVGLEDLFQVSRVDLVELPEAHPFLAANAIQGERLFSRDAYSANEYELYVLRKAGDLAPFERERLSLIQGK
jgi:hypothetical protein